MATLNSRPSNDKFLLKYGLSFQGNQISISEVIRYVKNEDAGFYLGFFTNILLVIAYGPENYSRAPFKDLTELLKSPTYKGYDAICRVFLNDRIGSGWSDLFLALIKKYFASTRDLSVYLQPNYTIRTANTLYDILPLNLYQVSVLKSWISEDEIRAALSDLFLSRGTEGKGIANKGTDQLQRLIDRASAIQPTKKTPTRSSSGMNKDRNDQIERAAISVRTLLSMLKTRIYRHFVNSVNVELSTQKEGGDWTNSVDRCLKTMGTIIAPLKLAELPVTGPVSLAMEVTKQLLDLGSLFELRSEEKTSYNLKVTNKQDLDVKLSDIVDKMGEKIEKFIVSLKKDKRYSLKEIIDIENHFVSLSTPGQQYIPNASPSVAWDFLQWYEFYIYQLDYYLYLDIFINMEISQNGGKTFVITRNLFNAAAPYEQTRNVLRLTDNLLYKDLWQKIVFLQTWYIYLFRVSSPRDVPDDLKTQFRLTYDYNDKRSAYNKGRVIYTFPSSVFYHLTSTEIRVDYGDSSNHYRLSAQNFADFMKEWWKDEPGSTAYKAFSAIADHQSYYGRMPILPLIDRRWTQGG